jgi:hypothetical protein
MPNKECQHSTDTHPHTESNGSVRTVTYCIKCGMEWLMIPKEQNA